MGARFSAPVHTGPGAHPASCTMGTGSFPGVKYGRGRAANHSPPSSAEVMEEYSYISTHYLGQTGPVTGLLYLSRNLNFHNFLIFPFVLILPHSSTLFPSYFFPLHLSLPPLFHVFFLFNFFLCLLCLCVL
jgi:hypothetical protein